MRLIKTLYGLKRSPRHWLELASNIFKNIGLTPCPNVPFLFGGYVDDSKSRVYVGLYVDDFIYYGDTPDVEETFRYLMAQSSLVTFEQDPTLFLGIKMTKKQLPDNKFSVHLSQQVIINTYDRT